MSESTDAKIRQNLLDLKAEVEQTLKLTTEAARPVSLDDPIGRVSRIDAIQNQQLAADQRRREEARLQQIKSALRRLENDEYGECISCGEGIEGKRLESRPEVPLCLACQRARE